MAVALGLFVLCPLVGKFTDASTCMKCPHYVGQMYEGKGIIKTATLLNCSAIEDTVAKVENEP
jgi:hypothetical protein